MPSASCSSAPGKARRWALASASRNRGWSSTRRSRRVPSPSAGRPPRERSPDRLLRWPSFAGHAFRWAGAPASSHPTLKAFRQGWLPVLLSNRRSGVTRLRARAGAVPDDAPPSRCRGTRACAAGPRRRRCRAGTRPGSRGGESAAAAGRGRPPPPPHRAAPPGGAADPVADLDGALAPQMRADDAGERRRAGLAHPGPEEAVAPVPPARDQPLGIREGEGIGQEVDGADDRRVVGQAVQGRRIGKHQRSDRQPFGLDPGEVEEAVATGAPEKHFRDVGTRMPGERHVRRRDSNPGPTGEIPQSCPALAGDVARS